MNNDRYLLLAVVISVVAVVGLSIAASLLLLRLIT
jgi:hypothetical protein